MKIIVVGLSPLGRRLADELSGRKGVELVLIDQDEATCQGAADRYDALVLQGDGTDPELLAKAGAAEAQALVAATGSDALNTVVGLLAKQAGTKQVVVVLDDLALRTACQAVGVDRVVSPVWAAASEIRAFLLGEGALDFSVAVSGGARVGAFPRPVDRGKIRGPGATKRGSSPSAPAAGQGTGPRSRHHPAGRGRIGGGGPGRGPVGCPAQAHPP